MSISATDAGLESTDEDWYSFVPDFGSAAPLLTRIELAYPDGRGALTISGDGIRLESRGSAGESAIQTYGIVADPGTEVTFVVGATVGVDNVYKVTELLPAPALPAFEIVEPVADTSICADHAIALEADASYPLYPDYAVPGGAIEWFDGATSLGTGNSISATFALGTHTLTAHAYGSTDAEATVTFTAVALGSASAWRAIPQPIPKT